MVSVTISVPLELAAPMLDGVKELVVRLGLAVKVQTDAPAAEGSSPAAPADAHAIADRVKRVRQRCSGNLWKRIQSIASAFTVGERFTLEEAAKRTGIPFGKVRSDWNVLGRPLKSEPGPSIFSWVEGSAPKAFAMSQAARDAILPKNL